VGAELRLEDYDYALPPERIAQHPCAERDGARMLCLERAGGSLAHAHVRDLPERLRPGDLLVVNATRVLAARLRGHKATGGAAEALLLGAAPGGSGRYRALLRARGRLRAGQKLRFEGARGDALDAEVAALGEHGSVVLGFPAGSDPYALGETPLPPYIERPAPLAADAERYQTVFARVPGSVAAPTAGLHLSQALLERIRARGVELAEVVLHVGPGSFRPLRPADLERGALHPEPFALPEETARAVARTRARGGRVAAVGTTTARVLETCAAPDRGVRAGLGETRLFLRPGSPLRVVDALLTNFHLPRSSLLLLVAAFAGRERVLAAYAEALRAGYRFYSYGDAMWIA
jgi:S-adenosylmethionine:tRNA ribosyltransferase-isomerase